MFKSQAHIFLIILLFSCNQNIPVKNQATQTKMTLEGGWSMEEVHYISADTTISITPTQPGVFTFVNGAYSIQWSPSNQARIPFTNLSKPTESEILGAYSSVIFNAGTFQYTDSTVVTTAMVAKVPGFEEGKQFYDYKIEGDQLSIIMTDETYPDGTKPQWSGIWKTKFILKPISPK